MVSGDGIPDVAVRRLNEAFIAPESPGGAMEMFY